MNMHWTPGVLRADAGRRGVSIGFVLAAFALGICLLLGGASRQNFIQVAIAEAASLPALLWGIWKLSEEGAWKRHKLALAIMMGLLAIPLIQLIPLEENVWANWPGHKAAADGLRAAGLAIGWRPISLTPLATAGHMLALIPPFAVFISMLIVSARERVWLASMVVGAALISILIGGMQIASGESSPLYFYYPTNYGSAVGVFSNRNHQATLLIASLPFAALWVDLGRSSGRYKAPLITAALAVFLVAIVGLVIVKSRAGVFLLPPAIIGSFLIVLKGRTADSRRLVTMIGGGMVVGIFLIVALGMGPLMERFSQDQADLRGVTSATVVDASLSYLPFGSGIGSFVPVYASVEPIDTMSRAFWNHAHNDLAELWLEAGVLAAIVLVVFLAWWLLSIVSVWRSTSETGSNVAQAATIATALIMVHSLVDYPLRTLAIACVFSLSCGLLEAWRSRDPDETASLSRRGSGSPPSGTAS